MHAFMALFFYELIRDQIVLYDTRGPWLWSADRRSWLQDHAFSSGDRGAENKNTEAPVVSKWCQRQILNAYLFIYVCLFICAVWLKVRALRSVWSATSCYHFGKKRQKNPTDLTPPETDFTQLFRNCSNTKALWIFLLILLDVSEENWCFFPPRHIFFSAFEAKFKRGEGQHL